MLFCQNCGRPTAGAPGAQKAPHPIGAGPTPIASPSAPISGGQLNRPHPVTPGPNANFTPSTPNNPTGPPPPMPLPMSSPASLVPGAMQHTPAGPAAPAAETRTCPHCNGATPAGLSFCQRCGAALQFIAAPTSIGPGPIRPGADADAKNPGASMTHGATAPPVDSGAAIRSQRWGTLVCLNRDGSQGAEYPLAGEFVDIGSDGQIRFDDQFLAPRHLRLSREVGELFAVALDRTNGSFLRVNEQVTLEQSSILLLGRELLLFEQLVDEEREVAQSIQHGVHVFGSPVREAWGRLNQLLPNGCIRDIRHLIGAEVIIGREEGDVVFADDEFLSRRHASLHWRDGKCHLQDLGSSNGSFVRIRRRVKLESGMQLRFGDQMVRIDITG